MKSDNRCGEIVIEPKEPARRPALRKAVQTQRACLHATHSTIIRQSCLEEGLLGVEAQKHASGRA
jgi:hypothetical protein